ncbi:hypothetical protein M9Y10_019032 [Tritrichomonas musculus]|uniref:Uncharacterized protein n=1 Tax=Tritrichomonas musculus TaxID=1915356 RepID=A0ABR2HJD5_9EUKA
MWAKQICSLLFEDSSLPEVISKPTKTVVGKYASFAIVGAFLSAVFVGCQAPANMPNKNVPDNMKLELAKFGSTISFANTTDNLPSLKEKQPLSSGTCQIIGNSDVKIFDKSFNSN